MPFTKLSEMEARVEVNPSLIRASTSSERIPSTHLVVGSLKVKGA